jgi:hypothetical protein
MSLKLDWADEIDDVTKYCMEDRSFDHLTERSIRSAVVAYFERVYANFSSEHDDINSGKDVDFVFSDNPNCPTTEELNNRIMFRQPASDVISMCGATCIGCKKVHWTVLWETGDTATDRWYGWIHSPGYVGDLYWLSSRKKNPRLDSPPGRMRSYKDSWDWWTPDKYRRFYATNLCKSCREIVYGRRRPFIVTKEYAVLVLMERAAKHKKSFFRSRKLLPGEIRAYQRRMQQLEKEQSQ